PGDARYQHFDAQHGIQADVPEHAAAACAAVPGPAPRRRKLQCGGDGARLAPARRDHQQRRAQRRDPDTMTSVYTSRGLEDLWQIHFSLLSGQEYTQPGMFIANRLDDDSPTMPIAPIATPGPDAPPAPIHNGQGVLDQSVDQAGWLIHRYQSAQR